MSVEELHAMGLSEAQARWMLARYREQALAIARSDPFRLAEEVPGVGFATADEIAARLGLKEDAPGRLRAGTLRALRDAADEGHTCLARNRLVQEAQALLQVERRLVARTIGEMAGEGVLIAESPAPGIERDAWIYLPSLHAAEVGAAGILRSLARADAAGPPIPPPHEIDVTIARAQAEAGITLAPAQLEAVRAALGRRLVVITGGPGTGKTTVLRVLLAACQQRGIRALLAAPTGRGARRMAETTGWEARTIHRLLGYAPGRGFQRNGSRPLHCELLVVDEASMVDIQLAHRLLEALPRGCGLLLVGDANQLPSVGPGQLLRDIIASGAAVVVKLTEIFRQAGESGIVANANRILLGLPPEEDLARSERDFLFIERPDPGRAVSTIVELVRDRIPRRLSVDPVDGVQVLLPMHRGTAGAMAVNRALQEALNPHGVPLRQGDGLFDRESLQLRVGDKVMQRRNDYEKGVFNGDIGRITAMAGATVRVVFDGDPVEYADDELHGLDLAYALSVHKSQGSEYPAIVLGLLDEHAAMLQRSLIYTALTRARRLAVIVGSRAALRTAVRRTDARGRSSGLVERLRFEP
jgi:exodeoxyribonuclease V alpha subunit